MSMGKMRWFFPAWNGDHRLVPHPDYPEQTLLVVEKPTADESLKLNVLGDALLKAGWIEGWREVTPGKFFDRKREVVIRAPLEKTGPLFVWAFKPGPAVLTAVKYEDGKVITCSEGVGALMELSGKIAEEAKKEPEKPKPDVAATVKRHTPSCPDCVPGSIGPASEVLLAFLSEEEHESWARERCIYVTGGLTEATYRIAHRHSRHAQEQSRICMDVDSGVVVHFHDTTVPPEEEVLAAKLILEHREPWLRNEATMLGFSPRGRESSGPIFKNPFGGFMDGVPDAGFTRQIGDLLSGGLLKM